MLLLPMPVLAVLLYYFYSVPLVPIVLAWGVFIPLWVVGFMVPKSRNDRKLMARWIDKHTFQGWPHHCLACRHLLADPESPHCESCGVPTYRIDTERPGVPPPREDCVIASLMDKEAAIVYLPRSRQRKSLTKELNFTRRRNMLFEAVGQVLAYALGYGFTLLILTALVSYWIWASWGNVWMVGLKLSPIVVLYALLVGACATHPWQLRRSVIKYGLGGALPWCLSCDADLRGNLGRDDLGRTIKRCNQCRTPVFEYDVDEADTQGPTEI